MVDAIRAAESEGGQQLLVLGKLAAILDAFTPQRPRLTRAQIRAATGLPASTCSRLVANLVAEGMLQQEPDGYRVGAKVLRWSAAAVRGIDLASVLHPVIDRLRDTTAESAAVYVRQGLQRTCVAVAQTRHPVIWQLHVGMSTPLHVGSGGRAILAFDPVATDGVLAGSRASFTRHTITGVRELRVVLERTRRTGVAVSEAELDHDVAGVSAPAFRADGTVAASVGVAGPAQRFTDSDVAGYIPAVRDAAREASTLLGGTYEPGEPGKTEAGR